MRWRGWLKPDTSGLVRAVDGKDAPDWVSETDDVVGRCLCGITVAGTEEAFCLGGGKSHSAAFRV
ncbi:hypothetical protein Ga0080559_TMP2812 [Salipiger profundus]|uniref:Uncharacterized protein n=1 Tax=Salipiger profundus TaxID=1229727 RepID=A0A1U7D677_9RHOB|nr:hypothetical protein Ga0080559_TMP2812 [Salipiger profundus]